MIHLVPMTEEEYQEYVDQSCRSYAIASPRFRDLPFDEAFKTVRDEFFVDILPQGFQTPGHFLWSIFDGQTRVGYLHLSETQDKTKKEVFAWNLEIFEPFRRQGLGTQAMIEAGKKLKEFGYTRVGLNVFGDNPDAIRLYQSMEFRITQIQMSREIE